jgi:drug/metabolite transporter (DMT)-like permease
MLRGRDGWTSLALGCLTALYNLALLSAVHRLPAFAATLGIAIVIVVSSCVFKAGDSRPLTLNMTVVSSLLLSVLCAVRGELLFPNTAPGWIGFAGAATFFGFALIAFYISVSMIGPVRTLLLSFIEPIIAAGFGVILLGEPLTVVQVAGVALVIIALIGATAPQLAGTKG